MIFKQDWWYENTQGPFWTWITLWSTLGVYVLGISLTFVLIAFVNPGFSITGAIIMALSAIFVALTQKPWKFLKPVLIADLLALGIHWFLFPGLINLMTLAATVVGILAGIGFVVYKIAKYLKAVSKYHQKPNFIVHHVARKRR